MDLISQTLARELNRPVEQIDNVIRLLDEGATIPFIARYRKELHGSMDDQLLRQLADRLQYLRNLEERKAEVRRSIQEQNALTATLAAALDAASTLAEVEDLYRPFRPRRRTRATIAREKGLEELARLLSARGPALVPEEAALPFLHPENRDLPALLRQEIGPEPSPAHHDQSQAALRAVDHRPFGKCCRPDTSLHKIPLLPSEVVPIGQALKRCHILSPPVFFLILPQACL